MRASLMPVGLMVIHLLSKITYWPKFYGVFSTGPLVGVGINELCM